MAIKEEEQKKNGMTIIDNMGGEKSALEKLNMKKADISNKMNTSQIKEYIRRAKSGQDVNDYLKQFDLKKIELDQLTALMQKRTYDVSAVTPSDVSVYFNGEKVEVKNFEQYASLYLGSKSDTPRVY